MANTWITNYGDAATPKDSTATGGNLFEVYDADWSGDAPAVGDLFFSAPVTTTDYQWLGFITNVDSTDDGGGLHYEITTSRNTAHNIAPSTHRFHALTESLTLPLGRAKPIRTDYDSGREVQQSLSGAVYATKVREATVVESFRYEGLADADHDAASQWFLDNGGEPFFWIDERGRASHVQILDSSLERVDRHGLRDKADLSLRLIVFDTEAAQ